MHSALIRESAVIIYNLTFIEPAVETKGFKIEINIGDDGSACQSKGDTMILQIL